ncbi:MAG TPA: orotidine-5'-phosphate decarboxylase, partial [Terrimesophilobacter sp.]|nr:orotidine-5'-phosphate decarboxylase [Terrimesophilobacter sp.]
DPHAWLLEAWGLTDDATGLREFGLRVVEAAAGRIGIVKPQVAFFERHGSAGFAALERVIGAARSAGLLVIADAKRGDLGSTVDAYGQAWLTPGSPLEADAMTVNAYQGVGTLAGPIALAREAGKGLLVLAATSNAEALPTQTAILATGGSNGRRAGRTVAAGIVDEVIGLNATTAPDAAASPTVGSFGVVIGATVDPAGFGIPLEAMAAAPATPVLAPGFGHQGAEFSGLRERYGAVAPFVIASSSRDVLSAGPSGISEALLRQAEELASCLG